MGTVTKCARGSLGWLFGLLLAAGCTRESGVPPAAQGAPAAPAGQAAGDAESGGVSIGVAITPDPPRSGENAIEMTIRGADGSPLADAAVTAVFSMPAMPSMNMPAMRSDATLAHVGESIYRGTVQLSMGGTWNVVVTVTRGADRLATKKFSIVAK